MCKKSLYQEFKHFEGQPVLVYTDDGRVYKGIDIEAYEDAVRIIDKCGRLILIEYSHIDAVVEPKMELKACCHYDVCNDNESGTGSDFDFDNDCNRSRK